ncbi:hypothetical protein VTN77DRAFT_5546 [Rasamsonia byssochlamydoides]|uniref:uncharacterized protein n=1 Tax=Rasamsonia byssochlamydoides TaxID=89139 RepID=UPI0037444B48
MQFVSIEEPQVVPRIPEVRRHRSVGASNRPTRSENISAMDFVKAGQRRLRLLSQGKADKRAKETASPTPKEKTHRGYRKLAALQQAGFLPPSASADDVLDLSRSSRIQRDVEAMGRPWLDDSVGTKKNSRNSNKKERQETHQRCESLSLGDLAALVEFSISFPDFEDEIGPPPYQIHQGQGGLQRSLPMPATDGDQQGQSPVRMAPDSAAVRGGEAFKGASSALNDHSGLPVTLHRDTVGTKPLGDSAPAVSDRDDAKSLADLLRATERLERNNSSNYNNRYVEPKGKQVHSLNQGVTDTSLAAPATAPCRHERRDGKNEDPKISSVNINIRRDITPLSLARNNGGPIPLKLVAECLPPRVSSKRSASYGYKPPPSSSPQSPLDLDSSSRSGDSASRPPRSIPTPTLDSFPRPQQTLLSPFPIQSRRARSVTPDGAPGQAPVRQKRKNKQQQLSPYYGVADVAPPPAPTKPLPSLPQSNSSHDRESISKKSTGDTESAMSSSSEQGGLTVPERPTEQLDSPTLGSTGRLRIRKHVVPRPSSSATTISIDMSEAMPSPKSDRPESTLDALEQARRDRAAKVHALRLRDMSMSRDKTRRDSATQSLHKRTPSRKDGEDTGAGADRKIKRSEKHAVSAAPSIPLPMDPPVTAQRTPSTRRRRSGSTSSLPSSVAALRDCDGASVSRSSSVRSTSGRSAHAATNGNSNGYHHRRSESASLHSSDLHSSDEEGLSMRRRSSRSHEEEDRKRRGSCDQHTHSQQQQQQQQHHASDAEGNHFTDAQQLPRVESPPRRGSSQEQSSPKSQYSQRTSYSHESRMSKRHSGHYLHPLEARVAQLERQNKMLQAALLAALDVGVTYDAECVRSGLPSPLAPSSAGLASSMSSLGMDDTRYERERVNRKSSIPHRPDSWSSVRDQHSRGSQGSFDTASSESDASMREVENMLSDLDVSGMLGEWNEECHHRSQRS